MTGLLVDVGDQRFWRPACSLHTPVWPVRRVCWSRDTWHWRLPRLCFRSQPAVLWRWLPSRGTERSRCPSLSSQSMSLSQSPHAHCRLPAAVPCVASHLPYCNKAPFIFTILRLTLDWLCRSIWSFARTRCCCGGHVKFCRLLLLLLGCYWVLPPFVLFCRRRGFAAVGSCHPVDVTRNSLHSALLPSLIDVDVFSRLCCG